MSPTEPPRWAGYSHEELYAWARAGAGPASSQYAKGRWSAVWIVIEGVEARLARAITDVGSGWEGMAATTMTAAATPLGLWASEVAERALTVHRTLDDQAEYAAHVHTNMPPPTHSRLPEAPLADDRAFTPQMLGNWSAMDRERDNAEARARELMETYTANSYSSVSGLEGWSSPPTVVLDTSTGAAAGQLGGGSSDRIGGPFAISPATLDGPAGTPPGGDRGGLGVTSPPQAGTQPPAVPTVPSGQQPPTSPWPGPGSTPPGDSGRGQGTPRPPGDAGTIGPQRWDPDRGRDGNPAAQRRPDGETGPPGRQGRDALVPPPPGRRLDEQVPPPGWRTILAPPGRTSAGPGSPTGEVRGRTAMPVDPLPPPARTPTGSPERPFPSVGGTGEQATRSTPRQGIGAGFLPMGAGAGAGGQGHAHRRPDYLIEDADVFADDRYFTPQVIGAEDVENPYV